MFGALIRKQTLAVSRWSERSSTDDEEKRPDQAAVGLLRPTMNARWQRSDPVPSSVWKRLLWISLCLIQIANLSFLIHWGAGLISASRRPALSDFEHLSTRPPSSDLDVGEDRTGMTPKCLSLLSSRGRKLTMKIVPTIDIKFNWISTDFFVPGPADSNITALVWDEWTHLLPRGNGMMQIDNHKDYPSLTDPFYREDDLLQERPMFQASWVHQLHCLFYIMKEYHRILHHGPDGSEYYIDPTHHHYHASHCFNYLRQAIACTADPTLEGVVDGGPLDGSGQMHVCKDREEVIAWYEAHRQFDESGIDNFPPPDATLGWGRSSH